MWFIGIQLFGPDERDAGAKPENIIYSGVVNAVYCGDKFEIWEYIYSCYGFETILAFFILFSGIFTIKLRQSHLIQQSLSLVLSWELV